MLKASRERRQKRIRIKIRGTREVPRLSVFRSNKYIYIQAIDDLEGKTLAFASEGKLKSKEGNKTERAKNLGLLMAQNLKKAKIDKIVFDKGSFQYHGRIEALAKGLREGGIVF